MVQTARLKSLIKIKIIRNASLKGAFFFYINEKILYNYGMLAEMSIGLKIYTCIVLFIFGTIFGSFLNCLAYRLIHGGSVVKGRSKCPSCGHTLGALDLVPIFSYIFLKGKCRYCKEKISIRYLISELILGVLFVLPVFKLDISFELLFFLIFTGCLFTLTITDLDDFIIPNGCIIVSIVNWIIMALVTRMQFKDILSHVITAFVVGGGILLISLIMDKVLKKESMGGGDIKLLFTAGLYLSAFKSLFMVLLACVIGLIFAFATKYRKEDSEKHFPFGPAIAAATYIMFLYGDGAVNAYLSMFEI